MNFLIMEFINMKHLYIYFSFIFLLTTNLYSLIFSILNPTSKYLIYTHVTILITAKYACSPIM